MSLFKSQSQNPLGLNKSSPETVRCTMRGSAGSKGQIVRFDLAASDGGTTASTAFGNATNPTANVLLSTASHNGVQMTTPWLHGVLMADVADDAQVDVCIRGVVQALGGDTSAANVGLSPVTGSELGACIDGSRIIAIALETLADGALKWVIFDGINGFGYQNDVAA